MTDTLFHPDEPDLFDLVCHKHDVEQLGRLIRGGQPPFVVVINGDWGSGKTSFLKKLHLYLAGEESGIEKASERTKELWPDRDEDENLETIWFDAWRYQRESQPVIALLQEIRTHFTWKQQLVGETKKLLFSALMSLDELAKKIGFEISKIQDAGERWERSQLADPLPAQLVRELMEQAIDVLIKDGKGDQNQSRDRLIIIIDDLDRCQGHVAFRLLEAIKVYLSTKNCVFVLGLDWQNTRKAVAAELLDAGLIHVAGESSEDSAKVGEKRASLIEATEYLSKLCQHVYPLPTLTDTSDYVRSLFCKQGEKQPIAIFRKDAFHVNVDKPNEPIDERWVDILSMPRLLPNNPRRIKNFINALAIYLGSLRKVYRDSVQPGKHLAFSHGHCDYRSAFEIRRNRDVSCPSLPTKILVGNDQFFEG